MSLTIVSSPAKTVTNIPSYNVTTSFVEAAGYNNVRIRANIYIDGIVKAVLEQPKGLADFNFYEALKAFCGKLNVAPQTNTPIIQPTYGDELLTGWTNIDFTTFTTAGRAISAAVKASGTGWAKSNNLGALAVGDIVVIGTEHDYVITSGSAPLFYLNNSDLTEVGYESIIPIQSNIRFIMVTTALTAGQLYIGRPSGAQNWAGTWTVKVIPAASTSHKGYPCVYFKVGFSEYYEDADGVTVVGDESLQSTLLFVPAQVEYEAIYGDYSIYPYYHMGYNWAGKFLNDSIRAGIEFKRSIKMDMRIMFVSEETYFKVILSTTIRGTVTMSAKTNNMGWGFINFNELAVYGAEYMITTDTADTSIWLRASRALDSAMSEALAIKQLTKCYPKFYALEFTGRKGLEVITFKGSPTIKNLAEKEYYKNSNKINLPYLSDRKKEIILRSLYETEAYNEILWQLINSTSEVWLYDLLIPYYKVIGIQNDETIEYDQSEMFINEITGEYV